MPTVVSSTRLLVEEMKVLADDVATCYTHA
jgi:hypothetical protein